MIDRVLACLHAHRFAHANELELQDAIAEAFEAWSIPFEREVRLNARDRLDFLVGVVAVEVKVQGSRSDLLRQLHRYTESTRVWSIVVASTRAIHRLPELCINEKPVRVVYLGSGL